MDTKHKGTVRRPVAIETESLTFAPPSYRPAYFGQPLATFMKIFVVSRILLPLSKIV
jgi:hypothetical protein